MIVKQGLKKPAGKNEEASIKKELVLSLPNKQLINNGFFVENCVTSIPDLKLSTSEKYEVEQAMLEVLIETQGMSDKAYLTAFKEKTEELRYKNEQAKLAREKRTLWNQTHNIDQRRF